MDVIEIGRDESGYPAALDACLGSRAPETVTALGNLGILNESTLALFCSIKCPGKLILETYHLADRLRAAGVGVISGFHSPMERECLVKLLRGSQPLIICPARSIASMRMPAEFKLPLDQGRLLLLSPFGDKQHRATAEMALYRNRFVAALADRIFVAYADPGGKTEHFCRDVIGWNKPLYTLDSQENANLLALGARPIRPESAAQLLGEGQKESPE